MNQMGDPDPRPSTRLSLLRVARRRRAVLILCLVLVPAAALVFSLSQPKKYSATATLLFQEKQYAQGLFGTSSTFTPAQTDPNRAAATDLGLVEQSIIAEKTARALKSASLTQQAVKAAVAIAGEGQSDLVQLTATTRSGRLSADLANTYAEQFIAYRREAERSQILAAQSQIAHKLSQLTGTARNTPAARELATRQQDLEIFASLQTGNAQLSQPAQIPSSTSSPRPVRNVVVGIFVGLLLGIGVALLFERFDRRIRDLDELEHLFGRPILGTVPSSRGISAQRQTNANLGGGEVEAFRMIRTNLRYFNITRDIRVVVVNSAVPGEGKSTISLNLATVAASSGQRALLVEADLRRPVLADWVGGSRSSRGLSDFLAGGRELSEIVRHVPLSIGNDIQGARTLDVVLSGPLPPNPSDLLESPRMSDFLAQARAAYDLVVIDTPPALVVPDVIPLFRHVDGVILIARLGTSRRDQSNTFNAQLTRLNAPVLGVVVNGVANILGYSSYIYDTQGPTSAPTLQSLTDSRSVTHVALAPDGTELADPSTTTPGPPENQ